MENKSSCTAIESTTGIGKSTMMRKHARELIRKLRASGGDGSIVVFVPTIKLAQEQMRKFKEEFPSLKAECFIGLSSNNPDKTNFKMCERTAETKTLIDKGIPISNLCGTKKSNEWCSLHINSNCDNPCGYSQQNNIHADIWFMAHQKLFTPKPSNINPAAVVIDEAFWGASINEELELNLSSLTKLAISSDYEKACKVIIPYLSEVHDGYLDIGLIRSNSSQVIKACYKALDELKRYYKKGIIKPSMESHEVNVALSKVPAASIMRFWDALARSLYSGARKTPYVEKVTHKNNDCLFKIRGKQNIHKDWEKETLLLDATLSAGITNFYFSKVTTKVIECPMSETTVTQISDMSLSKRMMLPDEKRGAKKYAELIKNLDKLISILIVRISDIATGVKVEGYSEPVKMLLVTNKAIEIKTIEHKDFPSGIATMHYGATSGIDIYKDVPSLIIAGRLMLPLTQAENLASILKGEVISTGNSDSMYPKRSQPIVTESSEVIIESDYHTDPIVEEVRYSKTEGEIVQAIGRARGLRRNGSNPLDVLILTNVPTPIKVDLLTTWSEVVPTKLELLLADNTITPLSHNELVRLYQDQFKSTRIARTAVDNFFKRYPIIKDVAKSNLSDLLPTYNINRENSTQFQHYKELRLVKYTRTTKGAKPCFAVTINIEASVIKEALSSVVGGIKSYQYICAFSPDGNPFLI